jgi:hypothetical protein
MLHNKYKSNKDNLLSWKKVKQRTAKTLKQGFAYLTFYKYLSVDLMNFQKLILFKEASVVLGVYFKTIYKLVKSHSIPFYRIPAVGLSFDKKELVLLLNSYRNPAVDHVVPFKKDELKAGIQKKIQG